MNWSDYHTESENYANQADVARFQRDIAKARRCYQQAAEQEELALTHLDEGDPRTLGIIAVSTVALYYKAGENAHARRIATEQLRQPELPSFAVFQLNELLGEIDKTEALLSDVEQWRSSISVSASDRERLQRAIADWKASAA
jgi:hypothetical protein